LRVVEGLSDIKHLSSLFDFLVDLFTSDVDDLKCTDYLVFNYLRLRFDMNALVDHSSRVNFCTLTDDYVFTNESILDVAVVSDGDCFPDD
jgi:hypothetical protein